MNIERFTEIVSNNKLKDMASLYFRGGEVCKFNLSQDLIQSISEDYYSSGVYSIFEDVINDYITSLDKDDLTSLEEEFSIEYGHLKMFMDGDVNGNQLDDIQDKLFFINDDPSSILSLVNEILKVDCIDVNDESISLLFD